MKNIFNIKAWELECIKADQTDICPDGTVLDLDTFCPKCYKVGIYFIYHPTPNIPIVACCTHCEQKKIQEESTNAVPARQEAF